ncbi:hypothetical protein SEVIR_2G302800v4 [Setaria viridis]|uniref:Uncharacterized protein n=2 Tax=Setaria TaxID=4554 RepID=A0A368Q3W3_SETIT|nr:uncharacterized protein LOC101753589 [Setaria italica]XP_034579620.1 uncharacterized protein LOC117843170 [Setaria viridis]RCV12721.1 hypothetical protein SETIT_2G291700v2 [Setaria italica]TKW34371.1 hypothetical protein SEVIR_2G302800v2 [Setaria viridis]
MAVACAPLAGRWEIGGPGLPLGGLFTEAEMAAADLLVQLSGSGGGDDGGAAPESPRSVNTCAGAAAWAEEEEREREAVLGLELDRRARKRYRLVSELYDATRPVAGAGAGAGSARKRKRGHRTEAEAEMAMRYGDQRFLGF